MFTNPNPYFRIGTKAWMYPDPDRGDGTDGHGSRPLRHAAGVGPARDQTEECRRSGNNFAFLNIQVTTYILFCSLHVVRHLKNTVVGGVITLF